MTRSEDRESHDKIGGRHDGRAGCSLFILILACMGCFPLFFVDESPEDMMGSRLLAFYFDSCVDCFPYFSGFVGKRLFPDAISSF